MQYKDLRKFCIDYWEQYVDSKNLLDFKKIEEDFMSRNHIPEDERSIVAFMIIKWFNEHDQNSGSSSLDTRHQN